MQVKRALKCLCMLLTGVVLACATDMEQRNKAANIRFLGEAYMAQGDYTSALKHFMASEKLYDQDPYLHNDLGLAYMAKEKLNLAIHHFNKAVEIKPDYAPARNNLGAAYMAHGKWDAAITAFKQVTGDLLYATPHYPLSQLGWAYYNKKEYQTALSYYFKALKEKPEFSRALYGLGRTYLAMDNSSEAVAAFNQALKNDPAAPEIYFYLATAYARSRNYAPALRAFKKVIELNTNGQLARQAAKEIQRIKSF